MIAQARRDNRRMDTPAATSLLGGLSPDVFMRRHWQKKPLLVRQALPGVQPPVSRQAYFDTAAPLHHGSGARLDRRSRMLHDERHVFINGESFRAAGRDARLMHMLADGRRLSMQDLARLSDDARALVDDWARAGWLHAESQGDVA